jgi:hypothetical protein
MKSSIRISTGVPNGGQGRLNPIGSVDRLAEVAQTTGGLGYHSLRCNEFLTAEPSVLACFEDPHTAIAVAGAWSGRAT